MLTFAKRHMAISKARTLTRSSRNMILRKRLKSSTVDIIIYNRVSLYGSSIVAVHGLDTSSPKTWVAYERDGLPHTRGRAFNWLSDEDMLGAVVPKACVWTFDYNANYHSNASVVDLLALGEMLLRSLSEVRTNVIILLFWA